MWMESARSLSAVWRRGHLFSRWRAIAYIVFLLMPLPAFVISLLIGTYTFPIEDVIRVIVSHVFNLNADYPDVYDTIVFKIRLPRILLAMMVGMALSVSGAAFQGIFRNPLVSPFILGISSGAAFGAALSLGVFPQIPVQVGAFFFGMVAVGLAYTMSRIKGRTPAVSLVLSGVIVSAVFGSLLTIIQFVVDEKSLQSIVYWNMGSLSTACWSKFEHSFPLVAIGCLIILVLRWKLNVLALGEEEARSVGMNSELYKSIFILASTLAASAAVAVAGIIGLVGLIVPHMVRMIFGPDHRTLIPLSMTFGAAFLVLVDDLARAALSFEVPVGVITTLLGAPFFVYLLRSTRGGGWE
jgi:iron complex transport system permease protein